MNKNYTLFINSRNDSDSMNTNIVLHIKYKMQKLDDEFPLPVC